MLQGLIKKGRGHRSHTGGSDTAAEPGQGTPNWQQALSSQPSSTNQSALQTTKSTRANAQHQHPAMPAPRELGLPFPTPPGGKSLPPPPSQQGSATLQLPTPLGA